MNISILGKGAWGLAIGELLQDGGHTVDWLDKGGHQFSDRTEMIVIALPTQVVREVHAKEACAAGNENSHGHRLNGIPSGTAAKCFVISDASGAVRVWHRGGPRRFWISGSALAGPGRWGCDVGGQEVVLSW